MLRLKTYKAYYKLIEVLLVYISNVFKYGTGKGMRKSVGPIILKIWKYHEESRRKLTSYLQQSAGRLTGLDIYCVITAL
jgi:hypothetical protein